jgi:hypothetical protein
MNLWLIMFIILLLYRNMLNFTIINKGTKNMKKTIPVLRQPIQIFFENFRLENFHALFIERVTNRNIMRGALWLLVYTSLPTVLISALIFFIIANHLPEFFNAVTAAEKKNFWWFPSIIFNPFFETLILAGLIGLSVKLNLKKFSIVVPAVIMAGMHSLKSAFWGATILCFFLIQSYAFFYGIKTDFKRSYLVVALSHSMHNAWVLATIFWISNRA